MKKHLLVMTVAVLLAVSGMVRAEEQSNAVQSNSALAYLTLDIENTPGWVAHVKGGYRWNIFRDAGIKTSGMSHSKNHVKTGGAASVGLGYNFGPRVPLTVGMEIGLGPSGNLRKTSQQAVGGFDGMLYSKQKVSTYKLDFHLDYDFRNCSRWTPFVGITGGFVLVSQKGDARFTDNALGVWSGDYGRKRRINFMGGARAGVKYEINQRITLSLYGSYDYLGTIRSKSFTMTNAGQADMVARTNKIKAHSIGATAGLRISF